MELIFLLMGIMIGLACGVIVSIMNLEMMNKEEMKPTIDREVYNTIGSDISLFEFMYGDNKHIPRID